MQEILDRRTGELITVGLGNWITLTELGVVYGVSPRKVRTVLREMDFVYVPGGGAKQAHRISKWALSCGFGRHHPRSKTVKHAFDVISPTGQDWIAERWADALERVDARSRSPAIDSAREGLLAFKVATGRDTMKVHEEVHWLADHFGGLTQSEIASILDVSQQLVSRYLNIRSKQRECKQREKMAERLRSGAHNAPQFDSA